MIYFILLLTLASMFGVHVARHPKWYRRFKGGTWSLKRYNTDKGVIEIWERNPTTAYAFGETLKTEIYKNGRLQ